MGCPTTVRRAGQLHDVGRIGVTNGIWDKTGRLSEAQFVRVRLHPYYTERILDRPGLLAPLAGLDAARLSRASRILAAAAAYQAMTQPRLHRPALVPSAAAGDLQQGIVGQGWMGQPSVNGVGAAGLSVR